MPVGDNGLKRSKEAVLLIVEVNLLPPKDESQSPYWSHDIATLRICRSPGHQRTQQAMIEALSEWTLLGMIQDFFLSFFTSCWIEYHPDNSNLFEQPPQQMGQFECRMQWTC